MGAMQADERADGDRLHFARELVAALERNDATAELEAVRAILGLHEKRLHTNLTRIASDLREALSASQFKSQLSRLAQSELPDAQHRLNRVIELTQAAADTSLTAVETALPLVKNIRSTIAALGGMAADDAIGRIGADAAGVEKCLSDVLIAQGFQDITGQIIRRIVKLVAELEQYLSDSAVPAAASSEAMRQGQGPAVTGLDADALQHQQDVDDLLGQLGL